jgi:hypothetical protein
MEPQALRGQEGGGAVVTDFRNMVNRISIPAGDSRRLIVERGLRSRTSR